MPTRTLTTALLIGALMGIWSTPAGAWGDRSSRPAAIVIDWNQLVNELAFAEDQSLTFKGARAGAMMHIAQHDALNAIDPAYEQFSFHGDDRKAHPVAAAAQAAHDVVVAEYPERRAEVDALLAEQLAGVRPAKAKAAGIELGRQAAAAILADRRRDGYDFQGTYTFRVGPGQYQTTPPFDGFVLQPGFRFARPFALSWPSRLRPKGPLALKSRAYAEAFDEVKEMGRVDSTSRTADQTGYALWWMEFAESSVNRLARELATQHRLGLSEAARLFAQLGVGIHDGYIAVWDSKFEYNHWRPYTAVREAGSDGNPRTVADQAWEPLRTTPPFPEYVSAHSVACNVSLGVLAETLGDRTRFTMATTTAPPGMPTRSFKSFTAAGDECADSRVRLGWHFRYATNAGIRLGRKVADYVVGRFFRPQCKHRSLCT
ncbi:MAG: vanadium-dependent haloperoxidase [Gaiellaceae bacterium]